MARYKAAAGFARDTLNAARRQSHLMRGFLSVDLVAVQPLYR